MHLVTALQGDAVFTDLICLFSKIPGCFVLIFLIGWSWILSKNNNSNHHIKTGEGQENTMP